jgi:proteasome lid subunit RPN8/RPN11
MNLLHRLLGKPEEHSFYEVILARTVVDQIIQLAKNAENKDFAAFLEGNIKNGVLTINKLVFQAFSAAQYTTFSSLQMSNNRILGIVRSHKSHDNRPSDEELLFFKAHGIVHCIICKPFSPDDIAVYNAYGEKIHHFLV